MNKIVTLEQATDISQQLRREEKRIVLAGGCFDVLHQGHLVFLENAKKQGDILFVALESDENVARLKGGDRPVNPQQKRAQALATFDAVDYVIMLPRLLTDEEYFELSCNISPHVIAITEGDPKQMEKEKQAKAVGGKVVAVTKRLPEHSTTQLLKQT